MMIKRELKDATEHCRDWLQHKFPTMDLPVPLPTTIVLRTTDHRISPLWATRHRFRSHSTALGPRVHRTTSWKPLLLVQKVCGKGDLVARATDLTDMCACTFETRTSEAKRMRCLAPSCTLLATQSKLSASTEKRTPFPRKSLSEYRVIV